jgi:RNA 2',3'-cyclic 3'-phosphodiesterase
MMEGIRSFIAIEVPELLRVKMEGVQRDLRRTGADVKWVRPEGIHLTLKFLGSISPDEAEKISQAIAPIVAQWVPFSLRIRGLGCFPSARNPRIIWLGIDQGVEAVLALQKAIEDTAAAEGFAPEDRPFKAHLTLGRVRSPKGREGLNESLAPCKDVEIGVFRADRVYLFKSELRPSGAVHTKLCTLTMQNNEPSLDSIQEDQTLSS